MIRTGRKSKEAQIRAYAAATYEVEQDGCWVDIAVWRSAKSTNWPRSVISACNPRSQRLPDAENQLRHAELQLHIQKSGVDWWPARGRSADFSWLEPSILVEAPLAMVDQWARRNGQHAIWRPPGPDSKAAIRIYAEHPAVRLDLDLPHVQLEWVAFGPTPPE